MIFQSASFGLFLVIVLAIHWTVVRNHTARILTLLAASLWFYGSYELWYLGLIVTSTLVDYHCGARIHASDDCRVKRGYLLLSLAVNLGLLGFFKYTDWILDGVTLACGWVGFDPGLRDLEHRLLPELFLTGAGRIVVPVGISFYTFQTMSYTIDIYRGSLKPARNLREFALFVAFFPQLVAGPIVRAVEFLPQFAWRPRLERADLHAGLYRLGTGLVKKVVLADLVGRYLVDPVYADPGNYSPMAHALCLYGFTFQIYYDFSGYSDCAIGVARLLGFRLPENFDLPFRARSVREFWRRWHMTLSNWVRDYIFFPLGGSRGLGEARVTRNLIVTMVAIGIWHRASILGILLGALNGSVMAAERVLERRRGGRAFTDTPLRSAVAWMATYHIILVSTMFIRAADLEQFGALFTDFGGESYLHLHGRLALAAGIALHFLPKGLYARFESGLVRLPTPVCGVLLGAVGAWVAILVVGETPFIYFQF